MEKIKSFTENIDIKSKSVILRADFNVPLESKVIQDKTRINLSVPFINNLLKRGAKVLLISHLGRPKLNDKSLTLKPIYNYLQEKLQKKVFFYPDKITNKTKSEISYLKNGELIFFENIRFNEGEINNSDDFAKTLASIGDIFINDAFSCSHRKQTSVHKITKYLKNSFAGPLFMKEIHSIDIAFNNKKKPITCIIGGSKISTKIGVITSLIKKVDYLIIVGAMANNFVKFNGNKIGKSLVELKTENIIEEIYRKANIDNCKIITPLDVAVSKDISSNGSVKELKEVDENDMILDIGPKTIKKINEIIELSKTVLWNGPAGYFENKSFSTGTISIAKKISNNTKKNSLISIVGGGDTISAIKSNALDVNFTHLSTAGGAFLEYIEGKNLPGIEVLK